MGMQKLLGVLVALGAMLAASACVSALGPSFAEVSTVSAGEPFTGPQPQERLAMRAAHTATVPMVVPTQAAVGPMQRWKVVGGDPCNPKAGCTLAWALAKSGWPKDVQDEFLRRVGSGESGQEVLLPVGWTGWMTFGQRSPKFWPNTIADFSDGKPQPAVRWVATRASEAPYNLYQVRRCGNWGGDRVGAPQGPPSDVPLAVCPPEPLHSWRTR